MSDLFVEIFPLHPDSIPHLVRYHLDFIAGVDSRFIDEIGKRLAARLRRLLDGDWLWVNQSIITDNAELNPLEVMVIAHALKNDYPDFFRPLDAIQPQTTTDLTASEIALFVQRTRLKQLNDDLQAEVEQFNDKIHNAKTTREVKLQSWDVNGQPSVSISIASRLTYDRTLQAFIGDETDADRVYERIISLWVTDGANLRGEIIDLGGLVGDHRERLLIESPDIDSEHVLNASPHSWIIKVRVDGAERELLAERVYPLVRLPQLHHFDVDPQRALQTLQMSPKNRAIQVRAVSEIAKQAGIIDKAFDSRNSPESFTSADFEMNLRFNENRVRRYNMESLADDFSKMGVYKLRPRFEQNPISIGVINTLNLKLDDFLEALRRQLGRSFPFEIEMIRERRVRVVSRVNLESAVRVIEKESPDIILAFFPDDHRSGDDEEGGEDATADYIKSLTLARGLPIHVVYEATMDNPDAMTGIILSILGKTGSTPFVLAEPIETADYVVGLDFVRQTFATMDHVRLTGIARVYRADGEFLYYTVREVEITDDKLPFVLVRDLFPQKKFARARVMIHHLHKFPPELLTALTLWGKTIGTTFQPIEIIPTGAPRLYALDASGVVQPTWGSAFKLNDHEALLVSNVPKDNITPQPLHIRTLSAGDEPIPIDEALRSVLVWTLLTYGAEQLPKLPVTVSNVAQLSIWLQRGNRFSLQDGAVPFWL
jgi:hypothetical protein